MGVKDGPGLQVVDVEGWRRPDRGHVPHQRLCSVLVQLQGEDLGQAAVVAGGAGQVEGVGAVVGLGTVLHHVGTACACAIKR